MSCENDPNHDQANYCTRCSTCHDCLAEALYADCKTIKLLQAENAKLKEELEALKGKTIGIDLSKNYTNKIKADAVLSIMRLDYDCETANGDSAWSSNTIEEHANKLEQDNE